MKYQVIQRNGYPYLKVTMGAEELWFEDQKRLLLKFGLVWPIGYPHPLGNQELTKVVSEFCEEYWS